MKPSTFKNLKDLLIAIQKAGFNLSDCHPMRLIDTDTMGVYHRQLGHLASWMPKRKRGILFWTSLAKCTEANAWRTEGSNC